MDWYPRNKNTLYNTVGELIRTLKPVKERVHGIIVPHAGYAYSGTVAGKAYALLENSRQERAIVVGPSHYAPIQGVVTHGGNSWATPLGELTLISSSFARTHIQMEHSIDNQMPFLQVLGFKEVLPLMVGEILIENAKDIAKALFSIGGVFVFSTDLSHFLPYKKAVKADKHTLKIIQKLKVLEANDIDACGRYPLLICMELRRLNGWKPHLIEYMNSGDFTGDKEKVVGYAGLWF